MDCSSPPEPLLFKLPLLTVVLREPAATSVWCGLRTFATFYAFLAYVVFVKSLVRLQECEPALSEPDQRADEIEYAPVVTRLPIQPFSLILLESS